MKRDKAFGAKQEPAASPDEGGADMPLAARRKPASSVAARGEAIKAFKRGLILDAARQVFAERGLEGASVRTIAAVAGCTTGAIYPYFRGKEEIYGAILSESLGALDATVRQAAISGRSDVERLAFALRGFLDYYRARPTEVGLGLYLFGGVKATGLTPELDKRLNEQLLGVLQIFGECIGRFSKLSQEDIRTEVSAAFTYLIGLLILYHTNRLKILIVNADQLLDHYVGDLIARLS